MMAWHRCLALVLLCLDSLSVAWGGAYHDVYKWIESRQLGDPATCTTRRLLLYHSYGANFEGSASVLKSIMLGLGEAMHSNRSLVWGAYTPPLMERGNASSCYNKQQGGLYSCHFRPLSHCDINDLWYGELVDLKLNGFDDSKRVSLMHNRRGLAAYIPPPALRNISRIATIWPAALAAFAFRLNDAAAARVRALTAAVDPAAPMHCAHVRHGDVKTLKKIYLNKAVYPFDAYFDAIKAFPGPAPGTVFVATDSLDGAAAVAKAALSWPPGPPPPVPAAPAVDDSADTAEASLAVADGAGAGASAVEAAVASVAVAIDGTAPLQLLASLGNETANTNTTVAADSAPSTNTTIATNDTANTTNTTNTNITNITTTITTNTTNNTVDTNTNISINTTAKKALPASAPPPPQPGPLPHFLHFERARSEFGAHIEATLGGCVGGVCSVPEDALVKMQARQMERDQREQREKKEAMAVGAGQGAGGDKVEKATASTSTPPPAPGPEAGVSARVERAVREAVEDLAVLSRCSALVGTATSHFSTMGMLLAWARLLTDGQGQSGGQGEGHGEADASVFPIDPRAFVMLDAKEVAVGQFESSHLLGTFRNQSFVPRKDGPLRYAHLEMRLRETELEVLTPLLRADSRNFGLPTMPYAAFDEIAAVWTSPDGNCSEMEGEALEVVGNYGADHSEWHPGKALACWQKSMDVLQRSAAALRAKGVDVEEVRDTLVFNMRTVRNTHFSIWNAYS